MAGAPNPSNRGGGRGWERQIIRLRAEGGGGWMKGTVCKGIPDEGGRMFKGPHNMAPTYPQFYAMVFGLYPESGRESWKH